MKGNTFWRGTAHVEVIPGTHIEIAAQQAIDLAKHIDGPVHFEFNGVDMVANKDSTAKDLEARWSYRLEYDRLARSLSEGGSQA